MASTSKMHAKRELSYDPQTTGLVWTLCLRDVEQNRIAAFPEGVTCKNCRKILEFNEDWVREQQARRSNG